MQAIYAVLQGNNCTLLFALLQMQQCANVQQMLLHVDGVLDELNGLYEDDMADCGLQINNDGDVVFTQQMCYEHAQQITARAYVCTLLELLQDAMEDASYEDAQAYCMLAIVQRNMFVQGLQ
jgi:hypothetical protein